MACVCIHLSCRWKGLDIPRSSDGKSWWEYIDPSINRTKLDGKSSQGFTGTWLTATQLRGNLCLQNTTKPQHPALGCGQDEWPCNMPCHSYNIYCAFHPPTYWIGILSQWMFCYLRGRVPLIVACIFPV